MTSLAQCPICQSHIEKSADRIPRSEITDVWKDNFNIAVEKYLPEEVVTHYICPNCRLGFFVPASPGDDLMYAQLQKFDWYYEDNKWEFVTASSHMSPSDSVLDVGCGVGRFLDLLKEQGFNKLKWCGNKPKSCR